MVDVSGPLERDGVGFQLEGVESPQTCFVGDGLRFRLKIRNPGDRPVSARFTMVFHVGGWGGVEDTSQQLAYELPANGEKSIGIGPVRIAGEGPGYVAVNIGGAATILANFHAYDRGDYLESRRRYKVLAAIGAIAAIAAGATVVLILAFH